MKINLIRHGRTAGNLESRYIGVIDEELCAEGITELSAKNYPECDVVICSPMKRCLQTAKLIYPNQTPFTYDNLRECNFGAFEGQNARELGDNPFYQKWIDSNGMLPFPEGEKPEEFRKRSCEEFLKAVDGFGNIRYNRNCNPTQNISHLFCVKREEQNYAKYNKL